MARSFLKNAAAMLIIAITLAAFVSPGAESARSSTEGTVLSDNAAPSQWKADKNHSQVGFKVRHLGISNVRGVFNEYDVALLFDPEDLSSLQVETRINVASIDTEVERRDNHLRSDDFFNAEQYPEITFVSKHVRNIEGDEFELVGDLTIRDVTREVVLDVAFLGVGAQGDRRKVGFEAETTINRFDYNLRWDRLTEAGGLVAGEDIQIILELEMEESDPIGTR